MENPIQLSASTLIGIIATLFSLVLVLIAVIWNVSVREKIKKLEKELFELKPRVQSIEDNHGNGLKRLEEKFESMRSAFLEKLSEVKEMVHKDKNVENQLNTTLGLLLKELQKKYENG